MIYPSRYFEDAKAPCEVGALEREGQQTVTAVTPRGTSARHNSGRILVRDRRTCRQRWA